MNWFSVSDSKTEAEKVVVLEFVCFFENFRDFFKKKEIQLSSVELIYCNCRCIKFSVYLAFLIKELYKCMHVK